MKREEGKGEVSELLHHHTKYNKNNFCFLYKAPGILTPVHKEIRRSSYRIINAYSKDIELKIKFIVLINGAGKVSTAYA